MKTINRFLRSAARHAKATGANGLTFTSEHLGNYFHTHGRNASAKGFVAYLKKSSKP